MHEYVHGRAPIIRYLCCVTAINFRGVLLLHGFTAVDREGPDHFSVVRVNDLLSSILLSNEQISLVRSIYLFISFCLGKSLSSETFNLNRKNMNVNINRCLSPHDL